MRWKVKNKGERGVKKFLVVLLFVTFTSLTFAQEKVPESSEKSSKTNAEEKSPIRAADKDVTHLKEIVVTTTPYPNPATPITTRYGTQHNVVTEEQIKEQNCLDFQSALRDVPGVMFQSKNLMGSQTSHSMYIRGRGASHPSSDFAILYDGVPRGGALFGQVLGDGIALPTIGSIEIFKSPQPSEFGSGYASVNVLPRYLKEEGQEIVIEAGGGSYATFTQSLSGGVKKGPYDVYASQSWASTSGHRDHARAQQQSYYANAGYQLNDKWHIRFLANYVGSQTLAPMPDTTPTATNMVNWPMAERFDTSTFLSTLTLNNAYEQASGYLKAYVNDTDFDLLQELNKGVRYANGAGGLWSRQKIVLYGIRAKEKFMLWPGGEILIGADLDKTEMKNTERTYSGLAVPGINGGLAERVWDFPQTFLISPYAAISQMIGSAESFHVNPSAGYRYFHHNEFQSVSSYQAGLVAGYKSTDININYARGVNYPSPIVLMNAVLTTSPKNIFIGIKPETVDHYEIGLTHTWPQKASLAASVFYDKGGDRYQAYMFGPIPVQFNDPIGKYEIRGLEITGTVTPLTTLEFFAGANLMDAKATGSDNIERNHMPYTPGFQLQAGAKWTFLEHFRLRLDLQHLQDVYEGTSMRSGGFNYGLLTDNNKLENFTLVNGRLGYHFDYRPLRVNEAEAYVAVNNIFNQHYEYAKGYSMPGITVFAGLSVAFR
jgi:outer membrane receptor protein involved in Fe transport